MSVRRWVVAQLGARMHYGIPRLLAKAGMLERLYTDIYPGPVARKILEALPAALGMARALTRHAEGIPAASVVSFPAFGLQYAARLRRARNEAQRAAAFLWAGRRFGDLVSAQGFGAADAVYAFNDAALEILTAARKRGLFTVLEQTIAPLEVERELLEAERAKFPGWEEGGATTAADHSARQIFEQRCIRQREEWKAADLIVCGSEFVAEGIRRAGGAVERCRVVPYGIDGVGGAAEAQSRLRSAHRPLRVLTVGAVGLRKGAPYLWQAAREMGGGAEFRIVGPVQITAAARAELDRHVQLVGPAPRNEMPQHYAWADVFLLPSLCEGSATATYEALAAGLPVVCTRNSGSVVTDGADGFLVEAGDYRAIVERLGRVCRPGALEEMSAAALETAREFTLENYSRRLLAALAAEGVPA